MYLQTQSIYNGQRSIYNYNGEKNVRSARIVHYLISCICVYMCICVFVYMTHLPSCQQLVTTQLASQLRSIPQLLSTEQQQPTSFATCLSARPLIIGEPPSFRFSSAWQPASNSLVKPLYQLVYLAWLALTEYEGWDRQSLANWSLRVLVATWKYLGVPVATSWTMYMYVCVLGALREESSE